jgi:integrase
MARQQRNVRLQTREARSQLAISSEPYWHEIQRGRALGYYKGTHGGSWWLREYRDGRYYKRQIGQADDGIDADGQTVFTWAQALAISLGVNRPTIAASDAHTVNDALTAYWGARRAKSPAASIKTDQYKAAAHIVPKLGTMDVNEISAAALRKFRDELVKPSEDAEVMRRRQDTVNRVWSILRAALNLAHEHGNAQQPERWRSIKPFRNTDRPRTRFLSAAEAQRVLNAMDPDMRALARGALYSGLRMGELLALKAGDVEAKRVHVQNSKSGKARTVSLDSEGSRFFEGVTAGLAGDAPIFQRANGTPWNRVDVSRRMAAACTAAKIEPAISFHDLRRTYASLLINSGAEPEIIMELLGHADLRMTMRAYAHLRQKTVAAAVEKHLPSFGLPKSNVRKLERRS